MNKYLKEVRELAIQIYWGWEGSLPFEGNGMCKGPEAGDCQSCVACGNTPCSFSLYSLASSVSFVLLLLSRCWPQKEGNIFQDNIPSPIFQKERARQAIAMSSD